MKNYIVGFVLSIGTLFFIAFVTRPDITPPDNKRDGLISNAETDNEVEEKLSDSQTVFLTIDVSKIEIPLTDKKLSEQILVRRGYTTSYNKDTKNANWVAWHLTKEHTEGSYPKTGVPYYTDDGSVFGIGKITPETYSNKYFVDLEAEEPRQEHNDWRERPSNIDHGHMCPAGDNKWDKAAMNQSFLLTNMCPQNERLNSGAWNRLEEKCRRWAIKYGEIFIVAGPIFLDGEKNTFGANKIAIPDAFFKVVLCTKGTPKAIGFVYNNDSSSQVMKNQVKSIDEIEEITGFDFFSSLPDGIENVIEAESNLAIW